MKTVNQVIKLKTKGEFEFIDLTDRVEGFVKQSGIRSGLINIQTFHTTAPLLLNEKEPLLLEDFKDHFRKLSPKEIYYHHNDFAKRTVNMCEDECKNGHSHCLAMHLPSNLTLNIIDRKLQLGRWQRIFLIELDHARERKVQFQILGD